MMHRSISPLFRRQFLILLGIFSLLAVVPKNSQGGLFDPKLKWRTLQTKHFNIHYYEGEEEVAHRLTVLSEKVYEELSPRFQWKPWGRTEVVVTNTTDISNGLTTVIPYNYVLLFIAPPHGESSLNYYDNWLEDLFRHEFAHVLHLDKYGGSASPFRWIFGKIISPNGLTPGWVREGIAVQQESLTGKGRANNSFSEMMLRTDIYNDQFLALDQMAGNQFEWPGFHAAYIYGGKFWTYLADKYGQDKVYEFSKRYSDSVWLFSLNNKARKTFDNKNFFKLHREWKAELTEKYQAQRREIETEGLTALNDIKQIQGNLQHPTLSRDGKYLIYLQTDYRNAPEIRLKSIDGSDDRLIAKDIEANQFSFSPDGKKVAYSMVSRYKGWYRYYDIYELDLETKKSTRLTEGKRAFHPDYAPDGKTIVYVANKLTSTQLYSWDIEKKKETPLTQFERSLQFSNPRFSPDGKSIAVSVWKAGNRDIVLYDLKGAVIAQITDDAAIDLNPVFSPDGQDIFYTSDLSGVTNVYRYHLSTGVKEKISNVLTGFFEPQYMNGKIYGEYYFGRGYGLKNFEYRPGPSSPSEESEAETTTAAAETEEGLEELKKEGQAVFTDDDPTEVPEVNLVPRKYNPFKKLFVPRFIQPGVFFTDDSLIMSFNLGSIDPIVRHTWYGGATYRTDANFLGGHFLYTYNRFWPSIFVRFNDFVVNYGNLFGIGQNFFEERMIGSIGVTLSGYAQGQHSLSPYYYFENRSAESFVPPAATPEPSLGHFSGFGLRYQYSRNKNYPAAISPEGGPRLIMDFQTSDKIFGASEPNEQVIISGDLREYVPLPPEGHVIAFRVAGGIALGDRLLQGTFRLGSATGESILSGPTPRLYTLRGLPQITFAGERALLLSGEYRLPLVQPQRGAGTWPIFLKNLHMAFFADYGSVFNGDLDFNNFLLGVGTELRADFVIGYGLPISGRLGYGIIVSGRQFIQGLTDPITGAAITNGTLILELGTSF
jgi:WD40 repeat protein